MDNCDYIGYKDPTKKIGDINFKPIIVPTTDPVTAVIASAVATAAATIAASWNSWRLFQGHSEWYLWDQDLRNKNYTDLIAITSKWYKDGGINNVNLLGTASDQVKEYQGTQRYQLLPIIYQATNDNFIGLLIAEYANAGALPANAVPKVIADQIYPQQSKSLTTTLTNITKSPSSLLLYGGIILGLILIFKKK